MYSCKQTFLSTKVLLNYLDFTAMKFNYKIIDHGNKEVAQEKEDRSCNDKPLLLRRLKGENLLMNQ